jgi:energy-converting hydrogenase B subunit D
VTAPIAVILALVAVGGAAVVFTREPRQQAIVASMYGLLLTVLFFALQAPDVALSELAVGMVAVPLMILLALSKTQYPTE